MKTYTSGHVKFTWDEQRQIAFKTLKSKLVAEPVLSFPEPNKPFIIETDASKYSVGGVLSQKNDDGQIHPISYFSTALFITY